MVPRDAAALRRVETRHNFMVLESSRIVGCAVLGPDGNIEWSNGLLRSWLELKNADPHVRLRLRDCVRDAPGLSAVEDAIAAGRHRDLLLRIGSPGSPGITVACEVVPFDEAKGRGSAALLLREAGPAVGVEAGMERRARLEALGSLTSGVAHDFNNLLTILVGNLSLLAEELRGEPRQFAKLKAARDAARRGGELIRQLLSFARQEPVASRPINPAKVIGRIAPLIERALGKGVSLELELDDRLEPIQGNSAQLESVIVNLAVNARDAIEDSGSVRIRVRGIREAGRHLGIEVSDDGAGMAAGVAERAFEPFFTTKPPALGSGLGLSMVRSYAEQFDGKAEIESRAGVGTTVRLTFPVSAGTVEDSAAMTMPVAALPAGNEHVVVLAGEESLRAMISQILGVLGYRCDAAESPEAITPLLRDRVPDLVISDGFEMPFGAGGSNEGRRPKTLMLVSAGAADTEIRSPTLPKPFSLPDLAFAVREALDA